MFSDKKIGFFSGRYAVVKKKLFVSVLGSVLHWMSEKGMCLFSVNCMKDSAEDL